MARTVFSYIDTHRLHRGIKRSRFMADLNYADLVKYIQGLGDVAISTAYCGRINKVTQDLTQQLQNLGYMVKMKEPYYFKPNLNKWTLDWSIELTVDVLADFIAQGEDNPLVVICSNDIRLVPLLKWLQDNKIEVLILAADVPQKFIDMKVRTVEIPDSMLTNQYSDTVIA